MAWRKPGGEKIVEIKDIDSLDIPDHMVSYPLNLLAEIIIEELLTLPNASVHFNHTVTDISQDDDHCMVQVEGPEGIGTWRAKFVVGCDGARSGVRKSLFGKQFDGYTWDKQIVTTNVYYDLDKYGWSDLQWTLHPDDWFISMRIIKDGLWRVAYGEKAGYTQEQLKERLPDKFRTILPGNPEPDQYTIKTLAFFQMHQRCVHRMRVGRVLLGGDAAHLCNPMGGLGLTGGIADMGSLADCLIGIYSGQADMSILDKYDEVRQGIYRTITDPLSTTNMNRMTQDADTILEKDPFIQFAAMAVKDPKLAADMFMRDLTLASDMTKFYHKEAVKDKLMTNGESSPVQSNL